MKESLPHPEPRLSRAAQAAAVILLVAAVLTAYRYLPEYDFINLDDPPYINENSRVQNGLTMENLAWAFTTLEVNNWHPLTWLSFMLDSQLYGLNPAGFHLTNLVFHIFNALLLFYLLKRMTGAFGPSLFVAAVFALHPLQVESVAWVSERKDVLSTFLGLWTIWFYLGYAEQPTVKKYLPVLAFFALGLMAKPMLVTWPFVLLLLDYWPLSRSGWTRLVKEKIPLFALSLASSAITVLAQSQGAIKSLDVLPLSIRLANALVSYVKYLGRFFYPAPLAVYYPHPGLPPWLHILPAGLILAALTGLVWRNRKRRPYLLVGWLWFLGTLVPVIGLIQVGWQGLADRYTYVPLIGLAMMVAWSAPDLFDRGRFKKSVLTVLAGAALAPLLVLTWFQHQHWQDSLTLFRHALAVTEDNYLAHHHLGLALARQGDMDQARTHFLEATRINPTYATPHLAMGIYAARENRIEEAVDHFSKALKIWPDYFEAHLNLARLAARQNQHEPALEHYVRALEINPDYAAAHFELGNLLRTMGRPTEALTHYEKTLSLDPNQVKARLNLAGLLGMLGRHQEAELQFGRVLEIEPDNADAHYNLGTLYGLTGRPAQAEAHLRQAIELNPGSAPARFNLGLTLANQGKMAQAADQFAEALRIDPDFEPARQALAKVREGR